MLVVRIPSVPYNVSFTPQTNCKYKGKIILSSANAFNLDKSKILSSGKE